MKIEISYVGSWRNKFLDGDNNSPLPKNGRKYIASSKHLKNNFMYCNVTIDTVCGVLCRLIGDQRKLYQSREDSNYYFDAIEPHISFIDVPTNISREVVYLRNINNVYDPTKFTGIVSASPVFESDYSSDLWGIFDLSISQLRDFILNDVKVESTKVFDSYAVCDSITRIKKQKPIPIDDVKDVVTILDNEFPDKPIVIKNDKVSASHLFFRAIYIQRERLKSTYDMDTAFKLTKNAKLPGISENNFTERDFMSAFSTGGKKRVYGNPYMIPSKYGKPAQMLTKVDGKLIINLDISDEKANELKQMIENASVSSFVIGKKGVAYVTKIN